MNEIGVWWLLPVANTIVSFIPALAIDADDEESAIELYARVVLGVTMSAIGWAAYLGWTVA